MNERQCFSLPRWPRPPEKKKKRTELPRRRVAGTAITTPTRRRRARRPPRRVRWRRTHGRHQLTRRALASPVTRGSARVEECLPAWASQTFSLGGAVCRPFPTRIATSPSLVGEIATRNNKENPNRVNIVIRLNCHQ